ncbi:MAG: hydroxyethylthiazole kinase [Legionella sp.]|nr:hydroxyethylthiazole kinase [Legionella sp.]
MQNHIKDHINLVRSINPLILNITNSVTINFIANGLLSLGASPIMTNATEELCDLIQIADAVVINIGTLDNAFVQLCQAACDIANQLNKPLVLDPVGAGASEYRTKTCLALLETFKWSIIRGNASEILSLAGGAQTSKGVDSRNNSLDAVDMAKFLAVKHDLVVAISGKTDVVLDKNNRQTFDYGSPIMPKVTGSGCLLTAVVAAFHAAGIPSYEASCSAVEFYGLCGEYAAKRSKDPGSFAVHFLDALSLSEIL